MGQDTRVRFIVTLVLFAFFACLIPDSAAKNKIPVVQNFKLNYGIDLAGGADLTYRVLYDEGVTGKADLTRLATDVIRNRIEQKKLKEPKVVAQGDDQIVIQLAGVDKAGLEDYKALIEQAGKLEFLAAASKDIQEKYNKDKLVPANYRAWSNNEKMGDDYIHFSGDTILLQKDPVIDGKHIVSSKPDQAITNARGGWVVGFKLNSDGAKLFDEAAAVLFKQKPRGLIAIALDGKILSKPTIQSESFNGTGEITGGFTEASARNLSIILKSGSLPAPIGRLGPNGEKIPKQAEAETFVGPTLGQDAKDRGFTASALTLILVALFMTVYYRTGGFISVITLVLNLVYLLGVMALFGATLTLPGIAGIVLTVGMAVDANILIFERIREEQARGKTASQAFEAGYERAFVTIMDSNLTTLMAGIVLYYFGTGPVQGFAVTLCIGIATTLFSVLYCGRAFMKMLVARGVTEFKMMKLMSTPDWDYLKVAKTCVLVSAIIVACGTAFFIQRGEKNFGPDFKGGMRLSLELGAPEEINVVRKKIQGFLGKDGLPKYPGADVQTVAAPGATSLVGSSLSRHYLVFTPSHDINEVKADIAAALSGMLSHEPFGDMTDNDVDKNLRIFDGSPAGRGWFVYVKEEGFSLEAVRAKVSEALKEMLEKNSRGEPRFLLKEEPDAAKGLKKLNLNLTKKDSEHVGPDGELRRRVREKLKIALKDQLSQDPYIAQGQIGPAVASQLKNDTVWAMIISWILMILYVAVRFASWRYGVAAVVALVHDALIAIAFTSLAGAIVPKSWGLSFEMNMTTMAAILTIVGFSINDTIVIFDRIRENLHLMKKASFYEIINTSVNQTMSRTILTSFTVWVSALVLYGFTMHTGGGIAEFAFPLLIGVLAGTYSTIYIASPILLWWYRGHRPATS